MSEWMTVPVQYHIQRRIIHVDMDAFFASVEIREHPELRTQPVVVGPDPRKTGGHGVVTTANYVARQYGVHSAMPVAQAIKLIPRNKVVFIPPHFELYRQVSGQIHAIFHQVTDIIEPISLDEAFLDVTTNKWKEPNTIKIANWLQQEIILQTRLSCSIGISYNKFLAKVGSDHNKPMGRTIIRPEMAVEFLSGLPIEQFFGVGKKMQEVLHEKQIYTGYDLQQQSSTDLITNFKKMGYVLYRHARGVDDSPVAAQRQRKSIGKELTYNDVITTDIHVERELKKISQLVANELNKRQVHGRIIVLKMRDKQFNTMTKRLSFADYFNDENQIYRAAWQLWQHHGQLDQGIRLLGITITDLEPMAYENLALPLLF